MKILFILALFINGFLLPVEANREEISSSEIIKIGPNALSIEEKWNFSTSQYLQASPVTADINGDGFLETIFGCVGMEDEALYCLDHNGEVLWTYNSSGDVITCPIVADLNKDNEFEIIFGTMKGDEYLVCLNAQGQRLWNQTTNGLVGTTPAVADINLDGYQEILVSATNWWVYCFDYNGVQIWNYTNIDITNLVGSPAIGDIHSDIGLEMVFGYNGGYLYCLNSSGKLVMTYDHTDYLRSSPIIVDLENDGSNEIIFKANDSFNCLDEDFNLKWRYESKEPDFLAYHPSIADVNNDGEFEVLLTFTDYSLLTPFIVCINSTGDELWDYDLLGDFASPSVIGDLDNDNSVDIILLDSSGHIYCLDGQGSINWIYNITVGALPPGGQSIPSPALGDIDADAVTEVIIQIFNDGVVFCLDFNGITSSGINQWNCLRGTMYHTGQMDRDGDFLDDVNEQFYGTDLDDWDTDDDLFSDGREVFFGTDPLDPLDYPDDPPTATSTNAGPLFGSLISMITLTGLSFVAALILQNKRKK